MFHCKTLQVVLLAGVISSFNLPSAMAGGTNRGENEAATPGPESTTVKPVTNQTHNRRKGTTYTKNIKTPKNASDVDSSSGNTSSDSGSKEKNREK